MTGRRVLRVSLVVVTAAALLAAGWAGARAFTSPEQWAAQSEPPPAEPILAVVEQTDLVDTRTVQATVVPREQASVALAPIAGAARSVVTDSPVAPGHEVAAGTVLARVNDSPVFVLASPFPFYRDLGVGDTGADVRVLQQNLVDLGLLGAADGDYGAGTARAVAALYRAGDAVAPTRPDPGAPKTVAADPADDGASAPLPPPPPPPPSPSSAYVPLSAMLAAPELPARLAAAPARGADLATPVIAGFESESVVIRTAVPDELRNALTPGASVSLTVAGDNPATGRVESVFRATAEAARVGAGTDEVSWADIAVDAPVDPARTGALATVSIEVARLAEDALVVPAAAVARQDAAAGIVLRREDDGTFTEVVVSVVATHAGRAAITGDLRPGDRVRVD